MVIVIILIILVIVFFIIYSNKDSKNDEVDMKQKYGTLLKYLLSLGNSKAKVNQVKPGFISLQEPFSAGNVYFDLTQRNGRVFIKCILEHSLIGEKNREWSFLDSKDQEQMFLLIKSDLENFFKNSVAPQVQEVARDNMQQQFRPVINWLKTKFPNIKICESECDDNNIVLMDGDIRNWYLDFCIAKYSLLGIHIHYLLSKGDEKYENEWKFSPTCPIEDIVDAIRHDSNLSL